MLTILLPALAVSLLLTLAFLPGKDFPAVSQQPSGILRSHCQRIL